MENTLVTLNKHVFVPAISRMGYDVLLIEMYFPLTAPPSVAMSPLLTRSATIPPLPDQARPDVRPYRCYSLATR